MARDRIGNSSAASAVRGIIKGDSWAVRIGVFLAMSALFFLLASIEAKKHPRTLGATDSTAVEDSTRPVVTNSAPAPPTDTLSKKPAPKK